MKLLSYLAVVCCLEGLAFAAWAWWLNPQGRLNRAAMAVGVVQAWWMFCGVFTYGADPATALEFYRLSYPAVLGINVAMGWFLLTLAGWSPRAVAGLLVPVALVTLVIAVQSWVGGGPVAAFRPGPWGNVAVPAPPSFWSLLASGLYLGLDAVAFGALVWGRWHSRSWRLKRLISAVLVLIVVGMALYVVLRYPANWWGLPDLTVVSGSLLTAYLFPLMARHKTFERPHPKIEHHLGAVLTSPALLLDKDARIVGANQAARDRFFGSEDPIGRWADELFGDPQSLRRVWKTTARLEGPRGTFDLSPQFDRFGDFVGGVLLSRSETPAQKPSLSPREAEVLEGILAGETNQALADRLFLAPGTVKRHVHEILVKTNTKDRAELIRKFKVAP